MSANELPRWDLSHLFSGLEDPKLISVVENIVPAAKGFAERWRGKVEKVDANGLLSMLRDYEDSFAEPTGAYAFAHLGYAADSTDNAFVSLLAKIRERFNEAHRLTLFFTLELDAINDDQYAALAGDPLLKNYAHYLRQLRKQKDRRLSESEESILALKSLPGSTAFVQLYSRLTSSFRFHSPIEGEDEKHLTNAEILALLKHPDRATRRRAIENFSRVYEEQKLTISSIWNAIALDHRQNVGLRGYANVIDPVNEGNELSEKAVNTVMEVTREHYHLARRYYKWKASALGVEKLWSSDLSAPLPGASEEKISYDTARRWVLDSFREFHPLFGEIAGGFFEENRIDTPPVPGKSGGAFCMGAAPHLPPYVLMNFTGKLRDATTLAHELGHGIHFTLAAKQPYLEYSPVLPLAETASVFGELLMTKKLLDLEKDPGRREHLVAERIEDIIATTFRQTMYTDFELEAHAATAESTVEPEQFCELWSSQLENLYGDTVETLDGSKWAWSAIPHFIHTRFYCYAYTFGELLVLALYRRYQEEGDAFAPKFISLLEAGGSLEPQTLVGKLEYNLEDPAFWSGGYRVLEEMLDELGA